jgi:hypothetical protein
MSIQPTMGSLIDGMFDLREQKRSLDAEIKKIEEKLDAQEKLVLERMELEGTNAVKGKKASASISTNVVANVVDWDKVYAFVKKTGNFQLFQRRISDPAFRELMELKGAVPGVEPFTKKKINLRVSSAA